MATYPELMTEMAERLHKPTSYPELSSMSKHALDTVLNRMLMINQLEPVQTKSVEETSKLLGRQGIEAVIQVLTFIGNFDHESEPRALPWVVNTETYPKNPGQPLEHRFAYSELLEHRIKFLPSARGAAISSYALRCEGELQPLVIIDSASVLPAKHRALLEQNARDIPTADFYLFETASQFTKLPHETFNIDD